MREQTNERIKELQDFYDRLDRFDWFTAMSDDHRVYLAGQRAHRELMREIEDDPEKKRIYDMFYEHIYSGKPWETEKQPKSERPE